MGYDLHITRTQLWFNSEDDPITLHEWKAYVAEDPEMNLEGEAEVPIPDGGFLVYKNPGLAVWTKYSGHDRKGNKAWFDHFKGEISVKNPDREIALKMLDVAKARARTIPMPWCSSAAFRNEGTMMPGSWAGRWQNPAILSGPSDYSGATLGEQSEQGRRAAERQWPKRSQRS